MFEEIIEEAAAGEPSAGGGDGSKLMESGSIRPEGDACVECQVRRGMPAMSADGEQVGWVAAVVIDAGGASTELVLARPQTTLEYYHLPLGMINRVEDGHVFLGIAAQAARSLLPRTTDATP